MMLSFRVAVRGFLRTPGFSATALVTIALCLGATLTIFSVMDSVLLRGLPFPDAERLVTIYNSYPQAGVLRDGASPTNYYERRGTIPALSHVALFRHGSAIVGEAGATARDDIVRVTPDFFETLGVAPAAGRTFLEGETNPGADGVVILTDASWRERFDGDPAVVGRTLRVDGVQRTVVGVLPAGFRFLSSKARLFLPYVSSPEQRGADNRHSGSASEMVARLRPGATLAQVQMQVDAQDALLAPSYRQAEMMKSAGFHSVVVGLHADHVASIRPTLLLLQGGVLLLVLIGAVNLMNLFLIRASGRARELAIRRSMGANRGHVVGQVLVETMTLAAGGGVLGLAAAAAGMRALGVFGVDQLPLGSTIEFGGRMALVALAATFVLGLVIALPIAWFNVHGQLAVALRSESRGGTANRSAQRLRHVFIVAQVSLAFVLLAGAGLLGVSLDRAMSVSPGFRADHVIAGQVTLPRAAYPDLATLTGFTDRLLEGLGGETGVVTAGAVTNIPLSGRDLLSAVTVRGHVVRPGESLQGHFVYGVVGDYFAALGVPLREGRYLTAAEVRHGDHVAVVDEDFARRYWPGRSAVGEQLFRGPEARPAEEALTVVGVVAAVKQVAVTDVQGQGAVYVPFVHHADASFFVVARTRQAPELFGPSLVRLVRRLDPDLPVDGVRSMDGRIADSLIARRSPALLAAFFAGVALLLAAVGTYGVLSYAVAQRRREIGVRLALGAQPREIGGAFLRLGLSFLAAGTLVGAAGAWAAGRVMQRILFDVPALHLPTLLVSAVTMAVVALLASLIPVRRAAGVDPMIAMAAE